MIDLERTAAELGKLVSEKGNAYGEIMDSTEQFLSILYPDGIPKEMHSHVGLQVRIFDKLRRSAHAGHDFAEDWRDIAGYGLQGLAHCEEPPAEDVWTEEDEQQLLEICKNRDCNDCAFPNKCMCITFCVEHPAEARRLIAEMEAEHGRE